MKVNYEKKKLSSALIRESLVNFYQNKYYNLFMNLVKFGEQIDYQQRDFIMRKFWGNGTLGAFKLEGTEGSSDHPQGLLVFVAYSPNSWNIYDYPISAIPINPKGVSFIPSKELIVDKEIVLGWCQRNKKSVKEFVEPKIQQLVDAEMVIRCNLNSHKMPWLFASTPEMEKKMKYIADQLRSDDPELFVSGEEAEMMKALVSGAPFIIDKLYNYKQSIENEIREYLGLDSLGVNEKKEHLITGEIEVNNDIIESSENCFMDNIKEFFERINKVFGINISVELNKAEEPTQEAADITKEDKEIEEDD